MVLSPPRAAAVGAVAGALVASFGVGAEAWLRGMSLVDLQLGSVTVWIVEVLPLMLALAGWGVAERIAVGPQRRDDEPGTAPAQLQGSATPSPLPSSSSAPSPVSAPRGRATPPPAPPAYVPTPAPAPRRPLRTKTVEAPPRLVVDGRLRNERILYVDAHPDAPSVVSALQDAGLSVVHVGDAASGSLARDAEAVTMAAVDPEAPGGEALISELLRHAVPVVRLGMAPTTTARMRTVSRPVDPSAVARMLAELLDA